MVPDPLVRMWYLIHLYALLSVVPDPLVRIIIEWVQSLNEMLDVLPQGQRLITIPVLEPL